MATKKPTPAELRDRRAKILLGVLGVVLVGILAIQLPRLMGGSSKSSPSAAAAPAATATPAAAGAGTTAPATPTSAKSQLASIRYTVLPQAGQLTRFSQFAPKDPFHQLIATPLPGTTGATSPAGAAKPATPVTKPPAPVTFTIQPQKTAPSGPLVPAALLKLNGKRRVVALNDTFPAKHPLFRLLALSKKAIWLQLISGSFGDGKRTLKVLRDHPVTIVNSTDGTRFVLALVRPTTAPQPAATATITTSTGQTAATTAK